MTKPAKCGLSNPYVLVRVFSAEPVISKFTGMFRMDLKGMQDSLIRKLYWGELLLTLMTAAALSWMEKLLQVSRPPPDGPTPVALLRNYIANVYFIKVIHTGQFLAVYLLFCYHSSLPTSHITLLPPHLSPLSDRFPRLSSFVMFPSPTPAASPIFSPSLPFLPPSSALGYLSV